MNDGVWNVSSTLWKMCEMIKFLVDFVFLWVLRDRGNFFYQIWSGVTPHIIPHINWCVLLISSVYLITKAPFAQPVGLCHVSLTLLCSTDPQTRSPWCVLIASVDGSRGHLIPSFTSCTVSKHPFSQGFFYNSNYAVWHSPLRQHACLFSSSKHAFTGFWLCTTTASGSVKVLPSHALPPRKINPLPRIRRRGCALTLRAGTNQHGVANGDGKGSREAQHDTASRLKTSQPLSDGRMWHFELSSVSYCRSPLNRDS